MKDWRRSPEPPGMMGLKDASYQVQGNWGQPEELEVDPAAPLPHTTPKVLVSSTAPSRHSGSRLHGTSGGSLYSMCLRVILRNISSVQDLGDMPYRNAKPILEECRIDQLIMLEEASPHLLEHTDEIWKRNCLRDFFHLRKKYTAPHPNSESPLHKEPQSWRRLYFRTKGEIEQAKVEAAKRIKDKYDQHRAEKEAKKLVVSDRPLMIKAARSGARRFGSLAAAGASGVSKGQSLINKARSGSVAQAKLTAKRPVMGFRTQGRSKAVAIEMAPEAAGVESRERVRPMVAPRRIQGGASEGLARMKEFSRPLPSQVAGEGRPMSSATQASSASSSSNGLRKPINGSQRIDADTMRSGRHGLDVAAESAGIPRLKPHQVAAAPPLTSAASLPTSERVARTVGSPSTEPSRDTFPDAPPPPDIARVERRKLNFFGAPKPSSSTSPSNATSSPVPAAAATGRSSSPRPSSPLSPSTEVRGMKRTHSSTTSVPTRSSTIHPPSSASSSNLASKQGGVRVVQAKRARASPRTSPPAPPSPIVGANADAVSARGDARQATPASVVRSPERPPSNSNSTRRQGITVQDGRMARASPAAMSSIFAPPLHRSR